MGVHAPAPKKKGRRPYAALVLVLIFGIAWCSWEEDPPESSGPSVVFVPTPEPEPDPLPLERTPIDSGTELDAGADETSDAGRTVLTRREPDVEEYMRRWRRELEPLFRHQKYPGAPTLFQVKPKSETERSEKEKTEPPDAGLCESTVRRLELLPNQKRDVVIAIDTSGSMLDALRPVVMWLAQLEKAIADTHADVQLLVVADQRSLGRKTKVDGGIDLNIGSYDALRVLVMGARGGPGPGHRWADYLRPNAELVLMVITDDQPRGSQAETSLKQLNEALGGMPFTFHVMGGFDTPRHEALSPLEPVAYPFCNAEGLEGVNHGEVYQELARLTHGLRVPLCHAAARDELAAALMKPSLGSNGCAWLLSDPRQHIELVSALSERMAPYRLLEERSVSSCVAMRRSYRMAGPLLVLCEDTCSSLKQEGYVAIEVKLECNQ